MHVACRDVKALLVLLTHLTQRDLVDFGDNGSAANGGGVDVAKVDRRTFCDKRQYHCRHTMALAVLIDAGS